MLIETLFSVGAGILAGAIVNWLASRLPAYRMLGDDLEAGEETATKNVNISASSSGLRVVIVMILLITASIYVQRQVGLTLSYAVTLIYLALFMLVGVIDVEHKLILNVVMIPAFAFAVLEVLLNGRIRSINAFAGYAIAQIVVTGFYLLGEAYIWFINRRRAEPVEEVAFGYGDITLATFCGLVVGFPSVILLLILMVAIGGLIALLYILLRLITRKGYMAHTALPYGPAILAAATLMILWPETMARLFGAQ